MVRLFSLHCSIQIILEKKRAPGALSEERTRRGRTGGSAHDALADEERATAGADLLVRRETVERDDPDRVGVRCSVERLAAGVGQTVRPLDVADVQRVDAVGRARQHLAQLLELRVGVDRIHKDVRHLDVGLVTVVAAVDEAVGRRVAELRRRDDQLDQLSAADLHHVGELTDPETVRGDPHGAIGGRGFGDGAQGATPSFLVNCGETCSTAQWCTVGKHYIMHKLFCQGFYRGDCQFSMKIP